MKLTPAQMRCLNKVLALEETKVREEAVNKRLVEMGLIVAYGPNEEREARGCAYYLTPEGGRALGYTGPAAVEA